MPYPENYDEDLDGDGATDTARVQSSELRQLVERIEKLDEEKAEILEARKEVLREAKGRGYDTKVLQQVVRDRKKDKDALDEFQAIYELYINAL